MFRLSGQNTRSSPLLTPKFRDMSWLANGLTGSEPSPRGLVRQSASRKMGLCARTTLSHSNTQPRAVCNYLVHSLSSSLFLSLSPSTPSTCHIPATSSHLPVSMTLTSSSSVPHTHCRLNHQVAVLTSCPQCPRPRYFDDRPQAARPVSTLST